MKKCHLALLTVLLLAGCSKEDLQLPLTGEIVSTGCASETKAGLFSKGEPRLILEYTPDGLRVTMKNAEMNCSIKNGGISCNVSVEGNVIRYAAYPTDGPTANCICLVEEMSSIVTGLKEGREYTIYYSCVYALVPIDFTYRKGFRKVIDPDLYRAPLKDIGGGVWVPDI